MQASRLVVAILLAGISAISQAAITTYTDRPTWLAATGGVPTVLTFEDFALSSWSTGSAGPKALYNSQGIDFLPFPSGAYPLVQEGSGANTTSGTHWLGNFPSTGFNETNNAIQFSFLGPIRSFGLYDVGSDDGYKVRAYDASNNLIGTGDVQEISGQPRFWGFIASGNIARVSITPVTGNGYIGLDNLQYAVPEPSTWAVMVAGLGLIAGGAARARRRE